MEIKFYFKGFSCKHPRTNFQNANLYVNVRKYKN